MIDSYSYPRLKGLIAAATDCLQAIARKAEEEARRVHSLTLTDDERDAIRNVLHHIATKADHLQREDYHLRSLLERTNHDAVPAARVSTPDENSLHAASELGNPGAASRQGEVTGNTQNAATRTGNTQEPVAWAVRKRNPPVGESPVLCWCESDMRSVEKSLPGCTVIPLHAEPQPALTDEERMAVDMAILNCHQAGGVDGLRVAATLRSLLDRTK